MYKWLIAIALFTMTLSGSTTYKPIGLKVTSFKINVEEVQNGDLIFRSGNSLVSEVVRAMDTQKTYSHVGILLKSNGNLNVIHTEPASKVAIVEPIESFISFEKADSIGVFRLKEIEAKKRDLIAEIAKEFATNNTPFDAFFDLNTEHTLYCTELVWQAISKAGVKWAKISNGYLTNDFQGKDYILPSMLLKDQYVHTILERQIEGN